MLVPSDYDLMHIKQMRKSLEEKGDHIVYVDGRPALLSLLIQTMEWIYGKDVGK